MKLKSLGVIGVGNMGEAIIRGVLFQKLISPSQVYVYDVISKNPKALQKELKVKWIKEIKSLVEKSDVIVLAVKPQNLKEIAEIVRGLKPKNLKIISILAGVSVQVLKKNFGSKVQVVRCMPNLAATVGESITALAGHKPLLSSAIKIFECCGEVIVLNEKHFHAVTALSGSGPAYYFLLMELATKEGVKRGLTVKQATLLAKQTALGASLLAATSDLDAKTLKQRVTSKGGTTEAALKVFSEKKFEQTFSKVIQSAVKRGEQLGKS